MLIISARMGEHTLITTPSGERITVIVLPNDKRAETSLGIDAPAEYQILREPLHQRLLEELHYLPIFQVESPSYPPRLVIAPDPQQAIQHYQRETHTTTRATCQLQADRYQHPDYQTLETQWLRSGHTPVSIPVTPA